MPAGHLVTRLQVPLDGHEHLDHLQHARRQIITLLEFAALFVVSLVELDALGLELLANLLERLVRLLVAQANLEPVLSRQIREVGFGDLVSRLELLGPALGGSTQEQLLDAQVRVVLDDAVLVVEILADPRELLGLVGLRTGVLLNAVTGEHLHVDHRPGHARGHAQRRVLHVRSLLAEDRSQQLLLGRELRLALRRHLADQHVVRFDLGADVDDSRLVEPGERRLPDVGNVSRHLLGAELGVTRHARELLDVDRREDVVLDEPLGDEDRVLEVVAVPGHERDQHVASQRQLAHVRRGAVGQHVVGGDAVADLHQRTLIDGRVLIRTGVLDEVVDIDTRLARTGLLVVHADDDSARVHGVNNAATRRRHGDPGVDGNGTLHSGADQRRFGAHERHRLALHVRSHQRPVGVVVLEKGNQRSGHGHDLRRCHVDVIDLVRR